MELEKAIPYLAELAKENKTLYVKCDPEIWDFTKPSDCKISIAGLKTTIALNVTKSNAHMVYSLMNQTFIDKKIICWNIKNIFSYGLYLFKKPYQSSTTFLDLKVLESYQGKRDKAPTSFREAVGRFKSLCGDNWDRTIAIYGAVYLPLIKEVLPVLETTPMINDQSHKVCHAYYDVAGGANGRFKTSLAFAQGYSPHSMGPEEKAKYKPPEYDTYFLYMDYEALEVWMLQWLSQDDKLGSMLAEGDLYRSIYKEIFKKECDESGRKLIKTIFLPVFYGHGAISLAEKLKVSEKTARELINTLRNTFPTASSWMQSAQDELINGNNIASDYFGRQRTFDEAHKVRNFIVQSPAHIVCAEKLIQLQKGMRYGNLIFHIHDGYGLYCEKKDLIDAIREAKSILEAESALCTGLKLRIHTQAGRRLDRMVSYERK